MKNRTELIVKKLVSEKKYNFSINHKKTILNSIAKNLDLLELKELSFLGQINCIKKVDLKLEATLTAVVTQECVVTLEPVHTKLVTDVERLFVKGWTDTIPSSTETKLETVKEMLTDKINLMTIIVEELSLELPAYPRVEKTTDFLRNLEKPSSKITDKTDHKPFAILSTLKEKMQSKDGNNE